MVRDAANPPIGALARRLTREKNSLGGVLLTTTSNDDVIRCSEDDAVRLMTALQTLEEGLREVPFGFWDGKADGPSWRALTETSTDREDEAAPAAARVARDRLQTFLESTQGALNTFG
jgi:hypothetical protein